MRQAIEAGRLTPKSVQRGPDGKYRIDPKRADLEWTASTYAHYIPLTGPTAPAARRPLPPGDVGRMVRLLTELMAELQADSREAAADYLPHVLEGATDWVRAAGREPTAAAVASALGLSAGLNGPAGLVLGSLLDAVNDPDMADGKLRGLARQLGHREAERLWSTPSVEEADDGEA